jgi:hypothetical protein
MHKKPNQTKKSDDVAIPETHTNRWVYLWSVTFNKDGRLSMQS